MTPAVARRYATLSEVRNKLSERPNRLFVANALRVSSEPARATALFHPSAVSNPLTSHLAAKAPHVDRNALHGLSMILADRIFEKAKAMRHQPVETLTYFVLSNIPIPFLIDDESAARITQQFFPHFKAPISMSNNERAAITRLAVVEWRNVLREHPELAEQLSRVSVNSAMHSGVSLQERLANYKNLKAQGLLHPVLNQHLLQRAVFTRSPRLPPNFKLGLIQGGGKSLYKKPDLRRVK